jgi:ATP-dependent Clp protease adaptor protein ClpS
MSNVPGIPSLPRSKPQEREGTQTRRLPPYNLILMNDDYHSMDFVVEVLQKVFGYNQQRAQLLMLEAHTRDRAVIWTGPKEVAELKLEQVQTYHETLPDGQDLGPLHCMIEPAPGA